MKQRGSGVQVKPSQEAAEPERERRRPKRSTSSDVGAVKVDLRSVRRETPRSERQEKDPTLGDGAVSDLLRQIEAGERRHSYWRIVMIAALLLSAYAVYVQMVPQARVVEQALLESKEMTLIDSAGNTRLMMRMYNDVPIVQLVDTNGATRMSFGLRFDESPFIDLADEGGKTRASFAIDGNGAPVFQLLDADGQPTFKAK